MSCTDQNAKTSYPPDFRMQPAESGQPIKTTLARPLKRLVVWDLMVGSVQSGMNHQCTAGS